MDSEKIFQLGLHLTDGIGSVLIRHLVAYFGSAQKVFETNLKGITRVAGIGDKIGRVILEKEGLRRAEKELKLLEKSNINLSFYTDHSYPMRLKGLYDAPVMVYSSGTATLNPVRAVGIVGTRSITDYGKNITEQIVADLVHTGATVVSGLAYGVDITAHRACLKHHIPTIAVMATGITNIYPKIHDKTAREIIDNGALVTENALHTKPDAPRFVARNRIIAGLSDTVIVVESAERGGSLVTAEFANNYNREVFAVPGDVGKLTSAGCNGLIRAHKAHIFGSTNDLIDTMRWQSTDASQRQQHAPQLVIPDHFTQEESQVMALLRQKGEMHIDNIAWQTQIHFSQLSTLLLNLEFQGYVRSLPGKIYMIC